ncbi:MAG: M23 family metallopeptidase [Bacilli bacterium]|nr:M23 family metallopeptidase [Bacilli bacterium]
MDRKAIFKILVSSLTIFVLALGIYVVANPSIENEYEGEYTNPILDKEDEIVSVNKTLINPYTDSNVYIINTFYNENDTFENQVKSIILYGDTYIKSTGIVYGCDSMFNVVSILDGEVISVNQTTNLGVSIEIKHNNDMISIYQALTDSLVKVGDKVSQGDIIGNSGTTNITKESDNQLYFELVLNGMVVNPSDYFNKEV